MKSIEMLATLRSSVNGMVQKTQLEFANLPFETLNRKPTAASWSILECYEHLNRYLRYYNPALQQRLVVKNETVNIDVASTWIGKKSIESMHPSNAKKQKTFRHMDPKDSALETVVITEFLNHQQDLLEILKKSERCDVNRIKIPVEFFKLIKLTLAETLQFVIVHQERHFLQFDRTRALVSRAPQGSLVI